METIWRNIQTHGCAKRFCTWLLLVIGRVYTKMIQGPASVCVCRSQISPGGEREREREASLYTAHLVLEREKICSITSLEGRRRKRRRKGIPPWPRYLHFPLESETYFLSPLQGTRESFSPLINKVILISIFCFITFLSLSESIARETSKANDRMAPLADLMTTILTTVLSWKRYGAVDFARNCGPVVGIYGQRTLSYLLCWERNKRWEIPPNKTHNVAWGSVGSDWLSWRDEVVYVSVFLNQLGHEPGERSCFITGFFFFFVLCLKESRHHQQPSLSLSLHSLSSSHRCSFPPAALFSSTGRNEEDDYSTTTMQLSLYFRFEVIIIISGKWNEGSPLHWKCLIFSPWGQPTCAIT